MLTFADMISNLAADGELIPFVAIVGGLSMVTILGALHCVGKVLVTRMREQTRRDLAAYIAEGTVDPVHAVALMSADKSELGDVKSLCGDLAKLASIADQTKDEKRAEKPASSRRGVRVGIFAGSNCC